MAIGRKGRTPKRRSAARSTRDRLRDAEATLEAIRTGQVDALVVSGPRGAETRAIEGAEHPYFVLLNAMSDGAVLLERDGAILFVNRSFAKIAGKRLGALRGSKFQRLVVPAERSRFERLVREGAGENSSEEFALTTGRGSITPVAIALSALSLERFPGVAGDSRDSPTALMAIITDLTHRRAAEAARARLLERVISAQDDERRRIARELHDETGQSLTALLVGLRSLADMAVPPEVLPVTRRLRNIAAQTVDDVGRLARGLHPATLDDNGLAAAAARYVEDYATSLGIVMDFVAGDLDSPRLTPLAAATMYRILQEALTNVARHARAKRVAVELRRDEFALELSVQDDGIGFEVSAEDHAASGLGLHGMRERATLLGGAIQIEAKPGLGTVVRARIPAARAVTEEE